MDVAVFSDIHGNYMAFQRCLEYALKKGIGVFIFLGDYLGEFPYPQRTMERLYMLRDKYNCFFLRGNKEDYWISQRNHTGVEWKAGTSSTGAMEYCYANLTSKDIDFFESLPVCREIKFDGAPPLLACHGSPHKNNEKMLPDDDRTKAVIAECGQRYILCGHTHIQRAITHDGRLALNPGAAGISMHAAGKAQFMILRSGYDEWQYEFVSLDYDKEAVIKEIYDSGLAEAAPFWSRITIHLLRTGEVSHGMVLAKAMEYCKAETGECLWYDVPEKYWERAVKELIGM